MVRSAEVEQIPHRELRNSSAEILRRVADGEYFEVTNHGEVVAVIGPPSAERLWETEVAKPATRQYGWHDIPDAPVTRPTQDILDELREDRV